MIVAADILDFLFVFLPIASLTHLAFRIGLANGRSRGGMSLFAGSTIITFSYLFKIYFDIVFGSVDAYWLFVLTFGAAVGLILAFIGTSRAYSFLTSTRSGAGRGTTKAAKVGALIAVAISIAYIPYFLTLDRPIYWRLGALCYIVSQIALFGIAILVGEFFSFVGKPSASREARLARILAVYYLAEPVVWLTVVRLMERTDLGPTARLFVNIIGAVVSTLLALLVVRFVRRYFQIVLRQIKTTYVDTLRVRVLRDLYIIGTGLTIFIFVILLIAESLYGNLRLSTLKSYAELRLSVEGLAAARVRSTFQDVVLRLQRSEGTYDFRSSLIGFQNSHDYIDAVGSADSMEKIDFLHQRKPGIPDSTISALLKGTTSLFKNSGTEVAVNRVNQKLEFLVVTKARSKYDNSPYIFALVNMQKILLSSIIDLNGYRPNLRLISPDFTVIYSAHENEIGKKFQQSVLKRNGIDAKDLDEKLRLLSETQFEGYAILQGQKRAGVGEYYILTATPLDFQGFKGVLTSVEREGSVSRLFRPTNSLLILAGLLIVGLFGGGLVIISVAFRWSMRLEKEVQNKIQELRSSEDKYRRIVENPYIGSFIMVDDRIIFSNTRLAEILETDVDHLSGSDLSVFVDSKDYSSLKNIFDSIANGEKSGDKWLVSGTTANGRQIVLSGYSSIINVGSKRGVQSLVIDSTSEFREKEKLEQFERLESMATLAAGIAHDFNNILQVVLGSSQLLQRRLAGSELKKYADNIANVALRGSDLSKRLLTFSRHKGLEQRTLFDVNAIIVESLPLFEETFPRTIKIETQLTGGPIYVEGDQSQIQQVIFNLAVNARDAMPHGGTLTIKTEVRETSAIEAEIYQVSPGIYAFIMIKDNGEGIPPELMSKVFEPFFTTKPPGKGTGLGLSVVYGIVRSHNGFLKVYSEVKKGTVFDIYLPLSSPKRKAKADTEPAYVGEPASVYGKKILLIDDEAGIREAGQVLLEQVGYTVVTAQDGVGALEIYKKEWKGIDLVILDLNMPELSGKEVLENFTIINPDVRVLISTGYITPEERAGLKGIVEVIEKPFDFEQLVEKVRIALESSPNKEV